jgi:hypothetical protein
MIHPLWGNAVATAASVKLRLLGLAPGMEPDMLIPAINFKDLSQTTQQFTLENPIQRANGTTDGSH